MACKTLIMHAVISASFILRAKAATFLLSSTCTYHSYLNCTRIFIINHGCAAIFVVGYCNTCENASQLGGKS